MKPENCPHPKDRRTYHGDNYSDLQWLCHDCKTWVPPEIIEREHKEAKEKRLKELDEKGLEEVTWYSGNKYYGFTWAVTRPKEIKGKL
jgi:hypothetical protein